MATTYANIVCKKIKSVDKQYQRKEKTYEQVVNDFLDKIIELQKSIDNLSKSIVDFGDFLHESSSKITQEEFLSVFGKLKILQIKISKDYVNTRRSSAYKYAGENINNYKEAVRYFRESIADLHLFLVELSGDREYLSFVDELKKML
jgi:GTP1/Obg family GTP-binding protein